MAATTKELHAANAELQKKIQDLEAAKDEAESQIAKSAEEARTSRSQLERTLTRMDQWKTRAQEAEAQLNFESTEGLSGTPNAPYSRDPFFHQCVNTALFALMANPAGASKVVQHLESYMDNVEKIALTVYERFRLYDQVEDRPDPVDDNPGVPKYLTPEELQTALTQPPQQQGPDEPPQVLATPLQQEDHE